MYNMYISIHNISLSFSLGVYKYYIYIYIHVYLYVRLSLPSQAAGLDQKRRRRLGKRGRKSIYRARTKVVLVKVVS